MILKLFSFLLTCLILPSQSYAFLLENMTLEQKIGQLLMVHFHGESANEEAKQLIQEGYVGSIIYYNWANGLHSPMQVYELSKNLQKLAHENNQAIPLFIAVDQEGGLVARLTQGFTVFPGNKALGMTQDSKLAELCAITQGNELKAVGINLNLSPVVDINSNSKNPIIGIRAFADSPNIVVDFAKSTIKGFSSAGILSVIKHFPGHGDVETDSHEDLPILTKSLEELRNTEFIPFADLAKMAEIVMTGHLIVPALDPFNCTTLSKDSLDILRNDLGFDGVIMSDSLMMEGLLKNCSSIEDAAIRALNAGCDIIMLGGKQLIGANLDREITAEDTLRIHQTLVQAVHSGVISESRVDEAVERVLSLKKRYLIDQLELFSFPFAGFDLNDSLADEIAHRSLKIIQHANLPLLNNVTSRVALIAPKIVSNAISQTSFLHFTHELETFYFENVNPDEEEQNAALAIMENADLIIFCSYNAWKNTHQTALINSLSRNKTLILITLRDHLDTLNFPQANLIIHTFSPTLPSIQAASNIIINLLNGHH